MMISKHFESERRAFCDLRRKDRAADCFEPLSLGGPTAILSLSTPSTFSKANRGVIEKTKLLRQS
jgi:hypothetical protein